MDYKRIVNILIIGVWSSLIFEIGLSYFIDKFGVTLFNMLTVLLILFFVFGVLTKRLSLIIEINKIIKIIFIVYAFYWLFSTIGLLYTPEKSVAFKEVLQYIEYTLILLITVIFFNNISYDHMVRTLKSIGWVSLTVLISLTVFTLSTGVALNSLSEKNRFSISPFDDYNVFVYSLILSSLLIFLDKNSNIREVLKYTSIMLLIILIGVMAGSRRTITLYGPISLMLPVLMLWINKEYMKVFKVILPLSLFMIIGFNVITNVNITTISNFFKLPMQATLDIEQRLDRGLSFIEEADIDSTTRTNRWEDSMNLISNYDIKELVIGRGTRSYFAEDEFIRSGGGKDSPHNFLLSAFIEGGIIKTLLILLFITLFTFNIIFVLKKRKFWTSVFLIVAFSTWILTTLISGLEFFYSKQFILIFLVNYFAYMERGDSRNELEKSNAYSVKRIQPGLPGHERGPFVKGALSGQYSSFKQ